MVEWKKLGDVCYIFDGTHQTPRYQNKGIRFVSVENIDNPYNTNKYISEEDFKRNYKYKPQIGDVLMTRIGDVGRCAVISKSEPIAYYVSLALLRPKTEEIHSTYIKHILESKIGKIELRKKTLLTAVPLKINLGEIGRVKIPVPSLSEQIRIVGFLNTFSASINNLKNQIVFRKKQLEQYRNELLDLEGHEGVSMRPLGDLCEIIRGNGVQKTDFTEKGVGCIHYGQIYTHYGLFTYTTNKFVSEATAAKAKKASKGDIIMTSTSENVEDVCKSVAYLGEDDIAVSSHALILKHNLDPKYLAHCTATYNFFKQKYKLAHGAKVVEIKPEEVAKIKIPVVAKPGQSLIVFILDKFEAIIANLEKQLELRQKQYEYYRNQLLTFE